MFKIIELNKFGFYLYDEKIKNFIYFFFISLKVETLKIVRN